MGMEATRGAISQQRPPTNRTIGNISDAGKKLRMGFQNF
jgi:hypothetical protein